MGARQVANSKIFLFILVVAFIVGALVISILNNQEVEEPPQQIVEREIITDSYLEDITNISELSTYEVMYKGVSKVMNVEKLDEADFYVYYEATVKFGIDFSEIDFSVDNTANKIFITLPPVEITSTIVDETSFDHMFMDDEHDNEFVMERTVKATNEDVIQKIDGEKDFWDIAEQRAKNTVEALVTPFITQLDETYIIVIN